MAIVRGKNAVLTGDTGGGYLAFACAQDVSLTEDIDQIAATTATSGKWRAYKAGLRGWKADLTGLMFLVSAGKFVILDLFDDAIRENGLPIKILFTDADGNTQLASGTVMIPTKTINAASASGFTKGTVNMLGTGPLVIDSIVPVGGVIGFDYDLDFDITT